MNIQPSALDQSASLVSTTKRRSIPWQGRLVLLAAIWGMSFLLIKVGDQSLAPLQVALARTTLGAMTLGVILRVQGLSLPRGRRVWLHLAVAALLLNTLPFSLFAYGETHTTSVLAGIFNATTPLFALPLAILLVRDERFTRPKLVGLIIGFIGVVVVLGGREALGRGALVGNLLCLGAALSYGLGFPYTRKYVTQPGSSAISLATGQLICGSVELAIITPWLTRAPTSLPVDVIGSMLVLGAIGTGIAYILNYSLIRDVGATTASTVTYLIPFFSTAAGVLFLGDSLTWNEPIGALVLILGVAISQGRLGRGPQPQVLGTLHDSSTG